MLCNPLVSSVLVFFFGNNVPLKELLTFFLGSIIVCSLSGIIDFLITNLFSKLSGDIILVSAFILVSASTSSKIDLLAFSFFVIGEDLLIVFILLKSGSTTLSNIFSSASKPSVTTGSDSNSEFWVITSKFTDCGPFCSRSAISSVISFSDSSYLGSISSFFSSSCSTYSNGEILSTNSFNPS